MLMAHRNLAKLAPKLWAAKTKPNQAGESFPATAPVLRGVRILIVINFALSDGDGGQKQWRDAVTVDGAGSRLNPR